MKIYLLRHAPAEEPDFEKYPDGDRPLSDEGRAKFEAASLGISKIAPDIEQIISSPLKRAMETAAIASKALETKLDVNVQQVFAEHGRVMDQFAALRKLAIGGNTLLVGHEPDLCSLLSMMTGMPESGVDFKKGALCRIDFPDKSLSRGVMRWFVTQRILKLAGRPQN